LQQWSHKTWRDSNAAHDSGPWRLAFVGSRHELTEVQSEVVLSGGNEREVRIHTDLEFGWDFNLELLGFVDHAGRSYGTSVTPVRASQPHSEGRNV